MGTVTENKTQDIGTTSGLEQKNSGNESDKFIISINVKYWKKNIYDIKRLLGSIPRTSYV